MPLPQKVIDRLSQEPSGTPGWSLQLLFFSGALFLISLIVYGGITLGHQPYYKNQEELLKKKIQTFTQQIPLAEQEKITSFYAQIVNIRSLLDTHVALTPFFSWLEAHIQPNVYLKKLSVNVPGGIVSFEAAAKTLADAEEQIAVFERTEGIKSSEVKGVKLGDKGAGWEFSGTISFPSAFFTRAPRQ